MSPLSTSPTSTTASTDQTGPVLVAPTSTSVRPASWRPEFDMDGTTTRIAVDQMTRVDTGRLGDFAGRLSPEELDEVSSALRWVLELL